MEAAKVVVMWERDLDSPQILEVYDLGTRGIREAMFYLWERSDALKRQRRNPEQSLWIEVAGTRWDHNDIIATAIMYDASFPPDQVGLLAQLLDEFAPDFVETFESRQSHLSPLDREFLVNITIGTEKQIKFAQDLFIDNDAHREARMAVLMSCMDLLEAPDVRPAVKDFGASLLILVPQCSVFWIEPSTTTDLRDMILQRLTGDGNEPLSREARRLGEQVDKALSQ